jgi:hypothetical protein
VAPDFLSFSRVGLRKGISKKLAGRLDETARKIGGARGQIFWWGSASSLLEQVQFFYFLEQATVF